MTEFGAPTDTKEAIAFTGLKRDFATADTDILGVSADPVAAQDKFRDKHGLAIALASDETKKMLTAYGVWGVKSMYGRKFMGVRRTTFLIGRDGRKSRGGAAIYDAHDRVCAVAEGLWIKLRDPSVVGAKV